MSAPLSTIQNAVTSNFNQLWPSYWTQYGMPGSSPTIAWGYGPEALTKQTAPNYIVAVLRDEPFIGSEVATSQPSGTPRQLSRFWTQLDFYCWGQPAILPAWTPSTTEGAFAPVSPTPANQNGDWFQTVAGGQTGLVEPTWPTILGNTVVDNTVTWVNMGPVDSYRIFDTDVPDLMRICVSAAMHYTLVGSYRPKKGTWYDKTDLLVMDGTVNKVSFEILIPVPDLGPTTAQVNTLNILGQLINVIP